VSLDIVPIGETTIPSLYLLLRHGLKLTLGDKYDLAKRHQAHTGIKIVPISWFDDSYKTEHLLPEGPYEQAVIEAEARAKEEGKSTEDKGKGKALPIPPAIKPSRGAQNFYAGLEKANAATDGSNKETTSESSLKSEASGSSNGGVWEGRKILLSNSLLITDGRRSIVEKEIQRAGGSIVTPAYRQVCLKFHLP
jgi:hypothetical protein